MSGDVDAARLISHAGPAIHRPNQPCGICDQIVAIRAEAAGALNALARMRGFARHDHSCIFAADLSGINGDEWAGDNARRCSCGFDDVLTEYARLAEADR